MRSTLTTATLLLVAAGCGRIGFERPDGIGEEPGDLDLPFDTGVFQLTDDSTEATNPALRWSGDEAVVVFEDNRKIGGIHLSSMGEPLSEMERMTAGEGSANRPRVSWAGDDYAVVFDDKRDGGDRTVYISYLGAPAEPLPLTAGRSVEASIAHVDGRTGVVWTRESGDRGSIGYAELRDGVVWAAASVFADDSDVDNRAATIAAGDSGFAVVWLSKQSSSGYKLMFQTVSSTGAQAGAPLVLSGTGAKHPELGWDGQSWSVLFTEEKSGRKQIIYTRVSRDKGIEVWPTPISMGANDSAQASLAVGSDGAAVAYRSDGAILYQRIDRDGVTLGDPKELASGGANLPGLVATDRGYLAAWQAADSTGVVQIFARAFSD